MSSPYKTHIGTHWHIDTSALCSMQVEYWILIYNLLDTMPAISAYSAIFPPLSAAIRLSVANHQAPLYAPMCWCALMHVLYRPTNVTDSLHLLQEQNDGDTYGPEHHSTFNINVLWWRPSGLLQFFKGEDIKTLASVSFGICTKWPNRENAWIIAKIDTW